MESKRACIYCGVTEDLSASDIIPDALTNSKIINPNVCREAHNNKFSDMFEDYVIRELALFTNELDIKSSKSKFYAPYNADIVIGDTAYKASIASEATLFQTGKIFSTPDGKTKFGALEHLQKIKTVNEENIKPIDINEIEIEKRVPINIGVFFSLQMHRLVTKIAFEWYCLHNDVHGKLNAFDGIIEFITTGNGTDPTRFVSNAAVYQQVDSYTAFGSHVLWSYISLDGSVNVVISLFGLSIYNVKILDKAIAECEVNAMFQELTIDAKRSEFYFKSKDDVETNFFESINTVPTAISGHSIFIPKDPHDTTVQYMLLYLSDYQLFQKGLNCIAEPTNDVFNLLESRMERLLQASPLTIRGIKRFVKEREAYLAQGQALNQNGTDKKSMFLFYCLFIIGHCEDIKTFRSLCSALKERFGNHGIDLRDDMYQELLKELFSNKDYFAIIRRGAEIVSSWEII